jgi:AraC family transcriptional regulator, regulatory protein of adaptative response / methylated-DNA-[protein]-cysteine methyltransferase
MREVIRYGWGTSSLGDFLVARSGQGLVAFEFSADRAAMEDSLRARLPEADVVSDPEEMTEVVAKLSRLVEQPGFDPGIRLDQRGTPFEILVWSMLSEIPMGETTTYGALAAKLGTRDARDVTEAIATNPIAILVPCHRVIKKDGSSSGYRWGVRRKRALLAREHAAAAPNGATRSSL